MNYPFNITQQSPVFFLYAELNHLKFLLKSNCNSVVMIKVTVQCFPPNSNKSMRVVFYHREAKNITVVSLTKARQCSFKSDKAVTVAL